MHQSVEDVWVAYNTPLEGKLNRMYVDIDGWVTTGMGNKIDPLRDALGLPWTVGVSGPPATRAEVTAAWNVVKNDARARKEGWPRAFSLAANNVYLSDAAVDALILKRLSENDRSLRARFPEFEEWPADAQLAVHSMVWAMGAGRLFASFPKCCRALEKGDFAAAANECRMTGGGGKPAAGTLILRNSLNYDLLNNAADAVRDEAPPENLIWQP